MKSRSHTALGTSTTALSDSSAPELQPAPLALAPCPEQARVQTRSTPALYHAGGGGERRIGLVSSEAAMIGTMVIGWMTGAGTG